MKKQLLVITVACVALTAFVAKADFFSDLKKKAQQVAQDPRVAQIREQAKQAIEKDPYLKAAAESLKARAKEVGQTAQALAEQQARAQAARLGKKLEDLTPEQVKQIAEQIKRDESVRLATEVAKMQALGAKEAAKEAAAAKISSLRKTIFG